MAANERALHAGGMNSPKFAAPGPGMRMATPLATGWAVTSALLPPHPAGFGAAASQPAFGPASGFGAAASQPAFGQASGFGAASSQSAFGQPSTFGAAAAAGQSAFGQPSGFGAAASQPAFGQASGESNQAKTCICRRELCCGSAVSFGRCCILAGRRFLPAPPCRLWSCF